MTDTEFLKDKIKQSGYKNYFIAEKIGISRQSFLNKLNNRSEFKAGEIQKLFDLLGLNEKERTSIFFS